ncbi:MAG: tRNA preQ1(34) S-adenosylmethionine ribosyltransferase-isomerase QueA [Anaerolineales bacterium]|nr:tRNA preQ1(34) S-adenosylmethionine ribosyltransferase-isomerase QueA [Anaerolineales bacterium]MCS7248528.1 tRNA preQ1(34) S-adenosylmethionine ribosyltransferase-isomerase QueA [Anaerolineales bacterium]MDW8162341.1 tRNA preQ1(34) S-adenosylmethionine ribosyltransferase-isomerase QueA [Anaerolineales bacterium]MDW8446004.1 tRNA preQ1(34) S-adenosylmethionine ribosyltransferase-isomerase QueA [Anaerolineales bacterium]
MKLRTDDFDYELPQELIAQVPAEPRDSARLLVAFRETRQVEHTVFREIGRYLQAGDLLVINETRVIPARLFATKALSGGKVEILLLKKLDATRWQALVGGKRVREGTELWVGGQLRAKVVGSLEGAQRIIQFEEPIEPHLTRLGHTPLPPYIHGQIENVAERYQTVYAKVNGSAAAPTAGLHFTHRLIEELEAMGVRLARVVLHIGLDTFAPVTEDDPTQHRMHTEWCQVPEETVQLIEETWAKKRRVVAVGTTSVRALETAAVRSPGGELRPYTGLTDLYILPGYTFKVVQGLITNFHLPRSTLLMLVSAFAGREWVLSLYRTAVQMRYRFYSFGDAMLIL